MNVITENRKPNEERKNKTAAADISVALFDCMRVYAYIGNVAVWSRKYLHYLIPKAACMLKVNINKIAPFVQWHSSVLIKCFGCIFSHSLSNKKNIVYTILGLLT